MGMRFGTCNVRRIYRAGSLKIVTSNPKQRDHLEDLGLDGMIIFEWILGKKGWRV
jgi:hypothetical protein